MGSSFMSKLFTYDPMTQLGVSKYVDPVANHFFSGYSTSSGPGTPGPYAGVAPTLADANAGYVRAAAGAANAGGGGASSLNNLFNGAPPINPVPKPVMKPQPVIPGQQQQQTWG